MSDETKVPAVPAVTPNNLSEVARALKSIIDVREGRIGDPLDANVTFRDLLDAGAVVAKPGFNGRSGPPVMPPWAEPDGYDPTTDLLAPPRPEGVLVTGMFALVMIQFNEPTYRNHAYAEIWRAGTNVIGNAVRIGTTDTRFYNDNVGSNTGHYYWVRFVSKANQVGPFQATDGMLGQTAPNPALVLGSLAGQITESQLYSSLASRISLIDAPASTPGSVDARLAIVQSQVNDLLSTPTYSATATYQKDAIVTYSGAIYQAKQATTGNAPTDATYWTKIGDYASLGGAVAAQATQIATLASELAAETTARTTLSSAVNDQTTGLAATRSLLVNDYYTKTAADSAISSAVTTLSNSVSNTLTGYVTSSSLTTNYYTKSATDSAINQATTALNSSIANTLNGYATNSSLTQDYYTKTQTDSAISSATLNLVSTTALNTALAGYATTEALSAYVTTASLTANYYTKTATDTAITSATQSLVSTTALNTALGSYTPTATLTANYYTKTQADSAISSATQNLVSTTALNTALGSYTPTATLTTNYYTKTQTDSAISSATQNLVSTTALNNALGSYTTTANLQNSYYTKTQTDSAISTATTTLSSSVDNKLTGYATSSALQTEATTRATTDNGLLAQYTVKTDLAGRVAGFGLASEGTTSGASTSTFAIIADRFYIAAPNDYTQEATPTSGVTAGKVWFKPSTKQTFRFDGSNWVAFNPVIPFAVQATPTTINGVSVPAGVYMDAAFIKNGTISSAKIANAAIDNAKIASLDATKITSGFISADRIQAGALDAKIANLDAAIISSGTINSARIGDASIGSAKIASVIESDNFSATAGWQINKSGAATFNEVSLRGSINGGAFTGYVWPTTGSGFHLGPSGLLLGNPNTGGYLQFDVATQALYAPQFSIVGGNATFSGSLSAASGTFSGSLTAQVVNTENIVGAAVTSGYSTSTALASASITITVPAGASSMVIVAYNGDPYAVSSGSGEAGYTYYLQPIGTLRVNGVQVTRQAGTVIYTTGTPPVGTYAVTLTRDVQSGTMNLAVLLTKR